MPSLGTPNARKTSAHEDRPPEQQSSSHGTFRGFLAAIWIVGAVVAFAVLFWIAVG
jgi:hypothetical protein